MKRSKTTSENAATSPEGAAAPAESDRLFTPSTQRQGSASSGRVEMLSTEFAVGWAPVSASNEFSYVAAMLDAEVIGCGVANISRPDLDRARQETALNAYGFIVVFRRPVPSDLVQSINVFVIGQQTVIPKTNPLKLDRPHPLRIFLMGSPRSGTSELGTTLSNVLGLPWLGEGHAAPLFSTAADALSGDATASIGLVRFMAQQNFRHTAIEAAKRAYFYLHGSASFVDKTPGVSMIAAAPFLNECFPGSHFIFLRRNPVANVLSRMEKFGGSFQAHCNDWAAAMSAWLDVRALLPHYLDVQQEEMLDSPERVATALAEYIGVPDSAQVIGQSLRAGSRERTGAGVGKTSVQQTGWTAEQIKTFERICGPAMRAYGYS